MKNKITAFSLTFTLLIGQVFGSGMTALADSGGNTYGHNVTYKPVTQLYTGNESVRFFDSQLTDWAALSDKITGNEANSIKWLSENNYLLNRFGRNYNPTVDLSGCFNSKGEWQTQLKGPSNVGKYYANVSFGQLADKEQREKGNISNIYDKGDLQYFFSWKVKTVRTRWGLFDKSNDYGKTLALGEWTESIGGGWKKYNTIGDGPNLFNSSAWKPGNKLQYIGFVAISDKDSQVDSYLSGAMLVGRDIKGPSISSVRVTTDIDGNNEIENGAITLDTIKQLNDRTVYFQVQWDEPVVLRNMSQSDIEKLSLNIETIGIDGTSGIIAEAPFLKFAPSETDAKPIMVFEYKIADPYTDSSTVTQERGYYYKFSKVTVSEKENSLLWNNIYDISGNRFASDENGLQPSSKVVTPVSGSAYVDLMPFGIENIRVNKNQNDGNAFIAAGGLLGITLELNKTPKYETVLSDLPEITLNIKDTSSEYITIKPAEDDLSRKIKYKDSWIDYGYFYDNNYNRLQPVMLSDDKKSITYYCQIIPGYTMDGNTVKVISVSSDNKLTDESGYRFMNYALSNEMLVPSNLPSGTESKKSKYSVAPDKQYKFDFDSPVVNLSADDLGEGIISITASVRDSFIEGCEAAFTVQVSGSAGDKGISYQSASSENPNDDEWKQCENGILTVAFASPVINTGSDGKAYGFVRLPKDCETDKITISAIVIDEAENSASAEAELMQPDWDGYDTLAPTISLSVQNEEINVDITDIDDEIEYSYGFSESSDTEPDSYTTAQGKQGTILSPSLPDENTIFTRVLWIKAKDSYGNESNITKLPISYDRTYTEIIVTDSDTSKQYLTGDYPSVGFNVKNATAYWYIWAEKPANVSDTAAYISEHCLSDMKSRAEYLNLIYKSADNTVTDFSNRIAELQSGISAVAVIDSSNESYGENVMPDKTSRPIMLVLAAEKEDGTTLVKTIEFDTFYGAPNVNILQNRFSTNDAAGNRVDYIAGASTAQLLSANDTEYSYPLNTPSLYGFAQAEFKLSPDPVTGIVRIDTSNSSITLERVVYSGTDTSGEEKERTVVDEWSFDDLGLKKASDSAMVNIDPNSIETKYYEYGEDGIRYAVRYEFICNMSCKGGISAAKIPISYFAFNNDPTAFVCNTQYNTDKWGEMSRFGHYAKRNIEAVFDKNGNDITPNVPVYTTAIYEIGSDSGVYVRFSANGLTNDDSSDKAYYNAPVINTTDSDNTSKLVMHIGTDPKNLSETIPFTYSNYQGIMSDCYDIKQYLSGDEDELKEVKLYYSFEYPERGNVSPVYVLKIRRDNTDPIFDISVSETERKTNEVLVKLNSVYDIQKAADGTIVTDTPENDLYYSFTAYREVLKDEDLSAFSEDDISSVEYYDNETDSYLSKTYVRITSDNDGIYHFTSNGYIDLSVRDNVGNRCSYALINGEPVNIETEGGDFTRYYINNVSNEPPKFISAPKFNASDGKFTLSAKADKNVKNVYLKFDKTYSEIITDNTSAAADSYNIKNVPGILSGGYDSDTGEINAEIYVKYSESVPLSSVTVIIEDSTGNATEYAYNFTAPIYGKKAEITNAKNENGLPHYTYGEKLNFSVPVKLNDISDEYALSHDKTLIYSDGIAQIEYTDLFGESKIENVYADVFGTAFAHDLKFTANGSEITPQTKISSDLTVTIDTSKTNNLSVVGNEEVVFDENGTLSYTLYNSELSEKRTFNIPITNIDKTEPEAIVTVHIDSERDAETNEQYIYSITYSVEGFSEDGVTLISSKDESAPSSVTFDSKSEKSEYTFSFRDEAGNEGSYTVDAHGITFAEKSDSKITDYRLTYTVSDDNGFRTLGQFKSSDTVKLELVNRAVSVKIEALNKDGETVSSVVASNGDLPDGTSVYTKEKLVMFTDESDTERSVSLTLNGTGSGNSITAAVVLPPNTIDMTPPTGTVNYKADENIVRAYLITKSDDLAENGIYVTGTKNDGTAFELKSDESGYYTELDNNGSGQFVLIDKAGNVGTVTIAVYTIDKEPPKFVSEGWQSIVSAKTQDEIKSLLETPTNNSIKLFITFNEQLSDADVKAFDQNTKELKPTENYVTAAVSGNAVTVEFKQNCRVQLTVYDLRGNSLVLQRPENGPITVIDRDIPKPVNGYPQRSSKDNKVTLKYLFDEIVMLLQDHAAGYKKEHTVTFTDNGTKILNFTDRAGNVYSDYPVITEIDELAPNIKISTDFVGDGAVLSGNDSYKAGNLYTSKNVRILLNVEDAAQDGITVTAKTKSNTEIKVNKESLTINEKTYNYNFIVSENGSYQITATDKWGNKSEVETNVSVIDKTAPTIKFNENTIVVKVGTDENTVRSKITQNTTAADLQSGANSPIGDYFKEVTDGITLDVDLSGVKLDTEGVCTAKIKASDRLGNTAERNCTVSIVKDIYVFNVNGSSVYANDVFTTSKDKIKIENSSETAKYYYSKGFKTMAQMKYAKGFKPEKGFDAPENGYYTVLVQETSRKMYLFYVYKN